MSKLSRTNASNPFSVSFSYKNGDDYEFIVNLGEINSLIYQTYKFGTKTFDSTDISSNDILEFYNSVENESTEGKYSFSAQGETTRIKEFGQEWTKTFSVQESCSVYLTIPKIPPGFDFYSDRSIGKNVWWFISPTDFINACHIETSVEQDFEYRLFENTENIEKTNLFQPDALTFGLLNRFRPKIFAEKWEYFGRVYIKLADIKILNGAVSVIPFLRSNIVDPSRYIRMGSTNFRFMKIFVWFVANDENSMVHKVGEEVYIPELFLKNITDIKENAKEYTQIFLKNFYEKYDENSIYTVPNLISLEESPYKDVEVYRVAILYTKYANGKMIFENVFEDISILNKRRAIFELTEEDTVFFLSKAMKEEEAFDFLRVRETDGFVNVIGFSE